MTDDPRARIAQVGPDPKGQGGMEAVLGALLTSPLAERYRLDPIVTYTTPHALGRLAVFARALARLARWCRGDGRRLVHVHTAVRGSIYRKAVCVLVAKRLGRPVLLHLHAGPGDIAAFAARLDGPSRRLLSAGFHAADAVISVSAASATQIERDFAVPDVTVVPNAAPVVPRPPGTADGGSGLLFLGGFDNPVKGGEVLVRAVSEVLDRRPDARVVMAGTGEPPAAVRRLVEIHQGVEWTGWLGTAGKAERLWRCDAFVMPSLSEGMPMALLEAMSCGRAIVASAVGGIPDMVADGTEALLVDPGDAEALAGALERVLDDEPLRRALGDAARERVSEFAPDAVYERYAAVYERLLARSEEPAGVRSAA